MTHYFTEFCDMCVLNGRNCLKNDYTSISTKGCAVVDYCLVPHDSLNNFCEFKVTRSTEIISDLHLQDGFTQSVIPDHSILSWVLDVTMSANDNSRDVLSQQSEFNMPCFDKFDVKEIPENFLSSDSVVNALHDTVYKLEQSLQCQYDVDTAYNELCITLKHEMYDKLSYKSVSVQSGSSNKKRKFGKPWWNDNLSNLWNILCQAENNWLKCNSVSVKRHH